MISRVVSEDPSNVPLLSLRGHPPFWGGTGGNQSFLLIVQSLTFLLNQTS